MLGTYDQLLAHLFGDYILQTGWMANNKAAKSLAAFVHVIFYGLAFVIFAGLGWLSLTPAALAVIVGTHYFIDRYRLAKYVCWAKDWIIPPFKGTPWKDCDATRGIDAGAPDWLRGWLFILVDNCMHLIINALALKYLAASAIG